jgi:hypothetical protein
MISPLPYSLRVGRELEDKVLDKVLSRKVLINLMHNKR